MKKQKFSHIDASGNPTMVDVSAKNITLRTAKAEAIINLGTEIIRQIKNNELVTKKGPVFQTAIIAGVMAAKKTSDLIPFCHPLSLEDCQVRIEAGTTNLTITGESKISGKTAP